MPYISPQKRPEFDPHIEELIDELRADGWNGGSLNYIISRLCWAMFREEKKYDTIYKIDGVLGNVSKEFYRRKAVLYEDVKIEENGDIE
jgi:hypothetical protein